MWKLALAALAAGWTYNRTHQASGLQVPLDLAFKYPFKSVADIKTYMIVVNQAQVAYAQNPSRDNQLRLYNAQRMLSN